MFKRLVLLPVLLALAAVVMPFLFMRGEARSAPEPDEPSTSPELVSLRKDADMPLTVSSYGSAVQTTMADYLPRAVAAEMPLSKGAEALKRRPSRAPLISSTRRLTENRPPGRRRLHRQRLLSGLLRRDAASRKLGC